MYFQPEIETMPRAELQALQLERLRESLRNAYENVPLYRERFDAVRRGESGFAYEETYWTGA